MPARSPKAVPTARLTAATNVPPGRREGAESAPALTGAIAEEPLGAGARKDAALKPGRLVRAAHRAKRIVPSADRRSAVRTAPPGALP